MRSGSFPGFRLNCRIANQTHTEIRCGQSKTGLPEKKESQKKREAESAAEKDETPCFYGGYRRIPHRFSKMGRPFGRIGSSKCTNHRDPRTFRFGYPVLSRCASIPTVVRNRLVSSPVFSCGPGANLLFAPFFRSTSIDLFQKSFPRAYRMASDAFEPAIMQVGAIPPILKLPLWGACFQQVRAGSLKC